MGEFGRQPTVVHLAPEPKGEIITFEKAFGEFSKADDLDEEGEEEHSNLHGRGRARRQKRRMQRQANKTARQAARQARKAARVAARVARKAAKHAGDDASAEAPAPDPNAVDPNAAPVPDASAQDPNAGAVATDQSGGQDQSQGGGSGGQVDGSGSQSQDSGGNSGGNDDGSNDPDVGDDSGNGGGQGSGGSSEDDGDSGDGSESSDYFDGVKGAEDYYSEFTDGEKKTKVKPAVADLAKKIEWNKELLARLRVKMAEQKGSNQDTRQTKREIDERVLRIGQLESVMKRYANFEGDFSSADGMFSYASGIQSTPQMAKERMNEIHVAKKMAFSERKKLHKGKHKHEFKKGSGGSETPVDKELNPHFSTEKIVVPALTHADANSSANGVTGLNGLDLVNDFDAPDVRVVELKSNITGAEVKDKIKSNWKGIAIGAGIAVGVILAVKLIDNTKTSK